VSGDWEKVLDNKNSFKIVATNFWIEKPALHLLTVYWTAEVLPYDDG
jgi:hypothetical protein